VRFVRSKIFFSFFYGNTINFRSSSFLLFASVFTISQLYAGLSSCLTILVSFFVMYLFLSLYTIFFSLAQDFQCSSFISSEKVLCKEGIVDVCFSVFIIF